MHSRSSRSLRSGLLRPITGALALVLVAASLSLVAPARFLPSASAAAWTVDTSARTEAEVRAKYVQLQPAYTGGAYAVTPSVVAPYAPGDAAAGFRTDGLNQINFGRYLAGLPGDVTLNATRNLDGQYGAVLLKASTFSHTPPKPADMDQAFYDRGYASTSSSNIGYGYSTSWEFQRGCLDDADAGNIDRVGHRRWLLNPTMLYTGIGYAEYFHTTYAFDRSRPAADVSYSFIAWPSAGVFPVEYVSAGTPWSITLNPALYDWDATVAGHTVTMRRVSDGRTWTFDSADASKSGEYFNAEFSGYGVADAFIFRPNPADISGYRAGDQFDVTLSGGIYLKGTRTPATVTYRTSFGALSGAATTFVAPLAAGTAPTAPVPPATPSTSLMPVYRFYNRANGSHFYTASAQERDTVIARYGATYSYEGAAYSINVANPVNNAPLYRFYNRRNGSHFYTPSAAERDTVIARWASAYTYEGPVYSVSLTPEGSDPMYRFYNKVNGSHFFTTSAAERDRVLATMQATYAYEGVCYYIGR